MEINAVIRILRMGGAENDDLHCDSPLRPRKSPLCGVEIWVAVFTDDPHSVAGCDDWLELVAEDLEDHNNYCGHCRQEITTT